jgi:hypothetical protein
MAAWGDFGVGVAVACAAAGMGKLAGLVHARRRLRATITTLTTRLAQTKARQV